MSILNKDYVLIKRKEYDCLKSNDDSFVRACVADFSTDTLAKASQIQYNANDTVCISDVLYKAVIKPNLSGSFQTLPVNIPNTYYYIVYNGVESYLTSITNNIATTLLKFDNTKAYGYTPSGSIIVYQNTLIFETQAGCLNNLGGIIQYDLITQTVTVIYDFDIIDGYNVITIGGADGAHSAFHNKHFVGNKDKQIINDDLFLLTNKGGVNDNGTALKINLTTHVGSKLLDLDTVSFNFGTPISLLSSKGVGATYLGKYLAVGDGKLFVYDTNNNTQSYTTINGAGGLVKSVANSIVVGDKFIVSFANSNASRVLVIDMNTLSSVYYQCSTYYNALLFNVNNNVFVGSADGTAIDKIDLDTNTLTLNDTTYSIPRNYSRASDWYDTQGKLIFVDDENLLKEFNINTNSVTSLLNISTQPNLSNNLIDINQAPIYLELC